MQTSCALAFNIQGKCSKSRARAANIRLPHGIVETPMFMPVGTQAALKGLTYQQLEALDCRICLNNTYHLGLKPGQDVLDAVGGAHKLQSWNRNLLTDSGGFQMVSLLKLATIQEEGVEFLSPHDGRPMMLTPEHSIQLQNSIGADIIMQLDDVVATLTEGPRVEEAMYRSIRWLDRCIKAHKNPHRQNLFAIIQGGLDQRLREICCYEMMKRNTPGIAIGILPEHKPRYCMGVGYAEDLVVSVALGADLFDCVYPTRTARFGNAITNRGVLNLCKQKFAADFRPIDECCECKVCQPFEKGGMGLTRSYIHHVAGKETVGAHLLTLHNTFYQLDLMRRARKAILEDCFEKFVRKFFNDLYDGDRLRFPLWAVTALSRVNIEI